MSIPWKSLKKAHDTLVGKADGFLAAGTKIPHVLSLIRVDTETGAIANCETADPRITTHIVSDELRMVSRIRQLLTEDAALGRDALRTFGFLPNVVMEHCEVLFNLGEARGDSRPPESHPNPKSALFVCVYTAAESFPVLHPILEHPTRHCEVHEFPAQSCEPAAFLAKLSIISQKMLEELDAVSRSITNELVVITPETMSEIQFEIVSLEDGGADVRLLENHPDAKGVKLSQKVLDCCSRYLPLVRACVPGWKRSLIILQQAGNQWKVTVKFEHKD
jgi:hypothetical protein